MADLTHKQWAAWELLHNKQHTEVLYGGAAGGGKSWLGCLWLLASAIEYPGSRWLMGRSRLKTLKETTLNSFFDATKAEGLKVGRDYTYNGQTNIIHIGQSEILLKDLFAYPSDPNFDELGSLELTGAFGDEVNQLTEKAKDIVGSRIRYKLDQFGLMPKFLMTCNPAKNWVYRDFYKPSQDGTIEGHRAFLPALVKDNPMNSQHYIENLNRLKGADRQRLLLGNWDYDDDPAALMDHDAITDLWTNEHIKPGAKYIVADIARFGHDKTVISYWEGMRWVATVVMDTSSIVEAAASINQLAKQEGVPRSHIVVDDDGIGGGVVDLLPGCLPFNGGAKPIPQKGRDQNYMNLKGQCSYELAQYVNDREMYIADMRNRESIEQELSHVKRYKMDNDGKLRVLPKEKVKESLGRSPDFADVMMMRMLPELRGDNMISASIQRKGVSIRKAQMKQAFIDSWR
jgi:phage terminase large subunit